jgi:hypothetical protein
MEFAERLREAMQREGLNASDVARRVWGEIQDKRGYYVARNLALKREMKLDTALKIIELLKAEDEAEAGDGHDPAASPHSE